MCSQQSKGAKYPQKSFNCADTFSLKITRFHAALKPIFRSLKPFQAFSSLLNLGARDFSFYMNTHKDCTRYDSGHPCHLNECVCLEERIEAGVVELNALARECFGGRLFRPLQRRLRDELNRQPFCFFLSDAHRERWTHWKNRCYGMSERNAAALLLLTADEELWQRVLWHFDSSGFDFPAIRLSGIHPELYSIYQAAKTISVGGDNIVIEDLAFSELVSDRAFRLILGALLLCRYGEVVLNLERKTEEIT